MSKFWKIFLLITGIVCILFIVFSIVFYLVFLPIMQENNKTKLQGIKDREQKEKEVSLELCLSSADEYYWEYMKSNDLIKDDGDIILAPNDKWDKAKKDKQESIDICFKKYPVN